MHHIQSCTYIRTYILRIYLSLLPPARIVKSVASWRVLITITGIMYSKYRALMYHQHEVSHFDGILATRPYESSPNSYCTSTEAHAIYCHRHPDGPLVGYNLLVYLARLIVTCRNHIKAIRIATRPVPTGLAKSAIVHPVHIINWCFVYEAVANVCMSILPRSRNDYAIVATKRFLLWTAKVLQNLFMEHLVTATQDLSHTCSHY